MSILIYEYRGFSSIVTMEDIIEEIMGDIDDEYDINNSKIKNIGDDSFIIKGNMSILYFNTIFTTNIKCEDYDTINGYIISSLDRIPCSDECINLLLEIDDNRIENVKVTLFQEKVS